MFQSYTSLEAAAVPLQLAIINNIIFPQLCHFFQVSSPCKLLQHVLIPDGRAEASTAFIVVPAQGGSGTCVRMWHWEPGTPVPLVPAAGPAQQGQEVPLILAGWQERGLHPWKSIPPSARAWLEPFGGFGFCLDFCFPFAGSDVALAPVVTCFISSSFNNVSTDPAWSSHKHSLSSTEQAVQCHHGSDKQGLDLSGAPGENRGQVGCRAPLGGGTGGSLPHK